LASKPRKPDDVSVNFCRHSRFTDKPNDLDVFNILEIQPPDEALLADCASLGHK